MALSEAGELFPLPKMIVFCAFTFDPEAAKDIDDDQGRHALKAQMNTDLLTDDLKKARASNQSFWLMGQPEVEVRQAQTGMYEVEVHGFDYFDTAKGELSRAARAASPCGRSTPTTTTAACSPARSSSRWPAKDGWDKLKKNLKAEIDEDLLEKRSTARCPCRSRPASIKRIAVKIVDDRGIESLKVMRTGATDMLITRLKLKNWRNFREVEIRSDRGVPDRRQCVRQVEPARCVPLPAHGCSERRRWSAEGAEGAGGMTKLRSLACPQGTRKSNRGRAGETRLRC